MTDQQLALQAINEAQLILEEYLRPRPQNNEHILDKLVEVLERPDLVVAVGRLQHRAISQCANEETASNRLGRLDCYALTSWDAKRAGPNNNTAPSATKSARSLVVLSSDRWTKVLVRRQAHAFEIVVGMAQGGIRATRFQQRRSSKRCHREAWRSMRKPEHWKVLTVSKRDGAKG
jgi:hypothetical protein